MIYTSLVDDYMQLWEILKLYILTSWNNSSQTSIETRYKVTSWKWKMWSVLEGHAVVIQNAFENYHDKMRISDAFRIWQNENTAEKILQ